jgi:glycosyltransferase involved in cell wall biosynthesis
MRVLLISPLPDLDPSGGDVTYTQTLLAHPPDGVQYETYAQAMARGTLQEHGNRRALKAWRASHISMGSELALTGISSAINSMRRAKWLFWEPFRFFTVAPGAYDLVHLNVFSARFLGLTCPVVVSNAIPLRYLYTAARAYSERRVRAIELAEQGLGKVLGMNVNSYCLPQASRVIAFTEFLRSWYVKRGVMPADRADTIPIYLPSPPAAPASRSDRPRRIGFIAKAFDSKGGPVLLEAFETVRKHRPDAELVIVGSEPRMTESDLRSRNITWLPYLDREAMLSEVLPSFDVFAYPTAFDGLPLVVLESMSRGVAIATSDFQALPEVVDHGRAGLISPQGDAAKLAENILRLLEPAENARYRAAARDRFESYYAAEVVRPRLHDCYERAIGEGVFSAGYRDSERCPVFLPGPVLRESAREGVFQ